MKIIVEWEQKEDIISTSVKCNIIKLYTDESVYIIELVCCYACHSCQSWFNLLKAHPDAALKIEVLPSHVSHVIIVVWHKKEILYYLSIYKYLIICAYVGQFLFSEIQRNLNKRINVKCTLNILQCKAGFSDIFFQVLPKNIRELGDRGDTGRHNNVNHF